MENTTVNLFSSLIVGLFVGGAAGYVGSLMVLKRMSLVGDALSHVALPGIALGILLHASPILSAFTALLVGVWLIWFFENKTKLPTEALVGIIFTASLAIGVLLVPDEHLLASLFGDISRVSGLDMALTLLGSIVIFLILRRFYRHIILGVVSKDLAKSHGINVEREQLVYLLLVAAIVALGIKVVGTLLMGALVIVPAAAARNISVNLTHYSYGSMLMGALSAVLGILFASYLAISPGPIVVLVSIGIFLLTLFFRR